ncbi:DNA-methyltransferase [Roseovarius indicus]|uniref:Methyltransferase n=1 Tax=Roseovarius indicus TaxID=540747 RepID=A0A0T5P855_9RHOB|nr:DNA methyltransferase [Roseovarius indicus]QEW26715.1 Modification methylase HindIII [Roseovarius indicus]SFD61190.1 site-specific DNA-methyltransferase (adenine-specific) [Roseovarius indicus]
MAETVTLHLGDCLDVLRAMPGNSVESVVTDPPYGLSFMGKAWDGSVPGAEMWAEVLRVLKPGGHLLAFAGTRTQHRMACAIEDAGFEIRDMIGWAYGSGFPKSHDVGKKLDEWQGWGTALKPAWEPITVARKPLEGTVVKNVLAHGTGALNIDGCRIDALDNTTKAWRGAGGRRRDEYRTGTSGASVPTDLGRWPANIIHDGSDEVLAAFPDAKGQAGAVGPQHGDRTSVNCYGDYGPRPHTPPRVEIEKSAARFFYCAKASKADRDHGLDHLEEQQFVQWQTGNGASGKPSSMSEGRDTRRKNTHPTVKPTDLMRYLCRLVTPPGGVVLDPFMGSGSTGRGAVLEGFRFIGIEMDEQYVEIARARIEAARDEAAAASQQSDLFEGTA